MKPWFMEMFLKGNMSAQGINLEQVADCKLIVLTREQIVAIRIALIEAGFRVNKEGDYHYHFSYPTGTTAQQGLMLGSYEHSRSSDIGYLQFFDSDE